jgi:hypothetical protein
MDTISDNRNGTAIFAFRTQKNLDFVVAAAEAGADIHPVTQAVLSLLAIIVFPWEHDAFNDVKRSKLALLAAAEGWPRWRMNGSRRVVELEDLVHVLRNSVAHGRIQFDSDSRVPSAVMIHFEEDNWRGSINAGQLIEFCRCFMKTMKNHVD